MADYDVKIQYHPRKVNVVADTLSRNVKSYSGDLRASSSADESMEVVEGLFANISLTTTLLDQIREHQLLDPALMVI